VHTAGAIGPAFLCGNQLNENVRNACKIRLRIDEAWRARKVCPTGAGSYEYCRDRTQVADAWPLVSCCSRLPSSQFLGRSGGSDRNFPENLCGASSTWCLLEHTPGAPTPRRPDNELAEADVLRVGTARSSMNQNRRISASASIDCWRPSVSRPRGSG
jgi:hypothetical protein